MSVFHSTVSRRDFMRRIGLLGAGVGAATLISPQFNDIDEVISAPGANFRHPWYVKQRPSYNPTIELDWNQIQPWRQGPTNPKRTPWFLDKAESDSKKITDPMNGGRWDIRYSALSNAARVKREAGRSLTGKAYSEIDTAARWSGNPEEAANLVRAGLHYLGFPEVHFLKLDDKTRKLITKGASIDDIEAANARSIIVTMVRKDIALSRRGGGDPYSYSNRDLGRHQVQRFITELGYDCFDVPNPSNSAFGVLAGGAELGRVDHSVTARYGTAIKVFMVHATNLELPEESPIDAGITRFCYTCKVCAELCDLQGEGISALSLETEPTWDLPTRLPASDGNVADYKRPGVKKWFCDYAYCSCVHQCWMNCTFNQLNQAFAHDVIRMVIPQSTVFNGFFSQMDRVFNYGARPTEVSLAGYQDIKDGVESWWNRDLTKWEYDVIAAGDNIQ